MWAGDVIGGPLARWLPVGLLALLTAGLLLTSGVALTSILAFSAYALFALTIPGTLLWRALRPERQRPWLEDVALGAILGYAIEIPTYLLARAAGEPLLVLLWPVAVYAYCLVTARGRSIWRPRTTTPMPLWWSWAIAGVTAYLVLFIARANWWQAGLSQDRLRVIGPDGSFQLALVGELRHHVPPMVPWVADEPLHYHWFTYVHVASASWITGLEPILLLRRLAPLLMALLIVLGTALLAQRLSRRAGVGLLAAGLLVLVHSPAFDAAEADHFQRQEFTSQAIFGSPTMTFGTLLFCGVLYLVIDLLRDRGSRSHWLLLTLLLAATAGAKATFAPMIVAGAVTVVIMGLLGRRPLRGGLGLLGLAAVVWMLFQLGFYGGASSGTQLSPAGTLDYVAASIGARTPEVDSVGAVALLLLVVLLWTVHMAGLLGLLMRGGWRDPTTVFLSGLIVSGLGASLLLHIPAFSQQWFVCSTQVASAVGAACGLGRLIPSQARRDLIPGAVTAALLAAVGMAIGWSLSDRAIPRPGPTLLRLWQYAAPFLITLAVLAVLAVVFSRLPSRQPAIVVGLVFLCAGLTGLGLFRTLQLSAALTQVPWTQPRVPPPTDTAIGHGGVEAARWLRVHSSPTQLVATNGHRLTPASDLELSFWLAGYSERRTLVQGWGYTARHSEILASENLEFGSVPFWDAQMLRANDQAFSAPTRSALTRLRQEFGVDWLVLDKRFPADPETLNQLVEPSYSAGDYLIYRLP